MENSTVLQRLGDREPSSREEAEAVLKRIQRSNGFLDEDMTRSIQSNQTDIAEDIFHAFTQLRQLKAGLASQTFHHPCFSNYLFFYRLIQFFDKVSCEAAQRGAQLPSVTFTLTQHFIIEMSAGEFTRDDIEAMCGTDHSLNSTTGRNLTAAFSIADEIHIQSNLWSFRLKHQQGDDGLGMIIPFPTTYPPNSGVCPRITLHLNAEAQKNHRQLVAAVKALPDTTLFFQQNIRRIRIMIIHDPIKSNLGSEEISLTRDPISRNSNGLILDYDYRYKGEFCRRRNFYYTVSHTIDNMPRDDRRTGQNSTTVFLAFPIDPKIQKPKLNTEGQYTFASLPPRRLRHIPFLIQSDLITSTNRDRIDNCDWNSCILDGVADAFMIGVKRFATKKHYLRYQWLDYLPTIPLEQSRGAPWSDLYLSVKTRLAEQTNELSLLDLSDAQLAINLEIHSHEILSGQPHVNGFLSQEYILRHHITLSDLGFKSAAIDDIIAKIRSDLSHSESIIQNLDPTDTRHDAFAELCLLILEVGSESSKKSLKDLALVPLGSDEWCAASTTESGPSDKIYFPNFETCFIPTNIGIRLVDRNASEHKTRRDLFKALGVEECPQEHILAQLSESLNTVLRNQSEKFFITLKTHWDLWEGAISAIQDDIKHLKVPCHNTGSMTELYKTYLPTEEVCKALDNLVLAGFDSTISVVSIPVENQDKRYPLDESTYSQWKFLERLGVSSKPDLKLYQDVLLCIKEKPQYSIGLTFQIYDSMAELATDEDYDDLRTSLKNSELILGENGVWFTLDNCLWRAPSSLHGYLDLYTTYHGLEKFFTKQLGLRLVTPTMVIHEIKRLAEEENPQLDDIRRRLLEVGMMIHTCDVDSDLQDSLDQILQVKFLPARLPDGSVKLLSNDDDFFISDHERYEKALMDHITLLDFDVDETRILHVLFQRLKLDDRYLGQVVTEESYVGNGGCKNEELSTRLQNRAYALYCCAAKNKSSKALREDYTLFQQLRNTEVYTPDGISTHLVVQGKLKVKSDRVLVTYDMIDGQLRIHVPEDESRRQIYYQTQLPKILVQIIGVGSSSAHDIAIILGSSIADLEFVLIDLDIYDVSWIQKPNIDESEFSVTERQQARAPVNTYSSAQYRLLVDQIIRIAQDRSKSDYLASLPDGQLPCFDPSTTFGQKSSFTYSKHVGAAGEAYVFERLSCLHLPNFSRENWQSNIRHFLNVHSQYSNLQRWGGKETADIVYADNYGYLTQYLRGSCEEDFPDLIPINHDHKKNPIEYFLEVKATPGPMNTVFYMNSLQYKRMSDMKLGPVKPPRQVYVLLRVFNITEWDIGMKIFVDPLKLDGRQLAFDLKTSWNVKIKY